MSKKYKEYYHPALFYVFKRHYEFLLDLVDPVELIEDIEQLAAELKAYSVAYPEITQNELFRLADRMLYNLAKVYGVGKLKAYEKGEKFKQVWGYREVRMPIRGNVLRKVRYRGG